MFSIQRFKYFTWSKVFQYVFTCILIISLIFALISNTIETLKTIGFYVAFIGSIIIAGGIHEWLIGKGKINWSENIELKKTSGWLCFTCCLFIYLIIHKIRDGEYNNILLEYSIYLIFSIFLNFLYFQ